MKKIVLIGILVLILLISGCSEQESEKPICNKPYFEYLEGQCCLDSNDNKICDKDETMKSDIVKKYGNPDKTLGGIKESPIYTDKDTGYSFNERWIYYLKSSIDKNNPDKRIVFIQDNTVNGIAVFYNDGNIIKEQMK